MLNADYRLDPTLLYVLTVAVLSYEFVFNREGKRSPTYITCLVIIRSVRKDVRENTERTDTGVNSMCVIQTTCNHNVVMGGDRYRSSGISAIKIKRFTYSIQCINIRY